MDEDLLDEGKREAIQATLAEESERQHDELMQAISSSRCDIQNSGLPLSNDGVVALRLTRAARSPEIRQALSTSPDLSHCLEIMADAQLSKLPLQGSATSPHQVHKTSRNKFCVWHGENIPRDILEPEGNREVWIGSLFQKAQQPQAHCAHCSMVIALEAVFPHSPSVDIMCDTAFMHQGLEGVVQASLQYTLLPAWLAQY